MVSRKQALCVHCGRVTNNEEAGYGSVEGQPLCHPNVTGRPDCYHLVTVYKHVLANCPICSWREKPGVKVEAHQRRDRSVDDGRVRTRRPPRPKSAA